MMKNSENQLKTAVAIPEVSRTETSNWHGTDWTHVNKKVFNLQKQIAKAEREGRGGKVKRLQNLLTPGTTKIRVILRDKCCLLAVQVFIKASRADEIVKGGSRDPHNFSNRCLRHLLIQKRLDLQFFTIEL
jgi:hypothetical protein